MANINVDFNEVTGKIKPMHAVGQPPFFGGFNTLNFTPINYLTEAHIPYSRLHDVGGAFGSNRYVDIPNIFRDFDADVNDPKSYDFAFTDVLLEGMAEYKVEPIFRLGVTIENQCNIRAYRIHPPKDYDKWAKICEHIIRHYNEGWADGYHYGITYWEIWNEPENRHDPKTNQMWTGTAEDYYRLYDVTSKHLKKCFGDSIKVGGYAATGFYNIFAHPEKYGMDIEKRTVDRYDSPKEDYRMEFLYGFFDYIMKEKSPIDFFSWHSYIDAEDNVIMAKFLDKFLKERGYGEIETMLNEWNSTARISDSYDTAFASAEAASMLLAMQNSPTSMLCYYDAKWGVGGYAGMFNSLKKRPTPLYYSFKAFGELYALGNQAKCESDTPKLYSVAGTNGKNNGIMISNTTGADTFVETNLDESYEIYLVDEEHNLEKVKLNAKEFELKENQVVLIRN